MLMFLAFYGNFMIGKQVLLLALAPNACGSGNLGRRRRQITRVAGWARNKLVSWMSGAGKSGVDDPQLRRTCILAGMV